MNKIAALLMIRTLIDLVCAVFQVANLFYLLGGLLLWSSCQAVSFLPSMIKQELWGPFYRLFYFILFFIDFNFLL